ncbi:putative Cytochrome 52A13 [Glarea lozoyensis 74030]|uniref:Putative Cytochrome 52A13 n=1 Tax=Glarea lozoyensis (strain ATCC 74030 / MF5533) TaxID=1104152 RepID=H0EQX9_GLAL7|nr:putative Cytochrome 52A13 [Glarea lozoyensis 74030]
MLGRRLIQTIEPENVKAVLATQFKDFGLPETRIGAFEPIFGHGIFTTNGPEWEASRALLRPSFTRSQVGDIATFEVHIKKLLARIPRDGSTVDLQDLFFELTLDSATDFLFGQSTNVLDKSDPNSQRGEEFGEAFGAVTARAGIVGRAGVLAKFLPYTKGRTFDGDKKFVHQYVQGYVQKAVKLYQESLKQGKLEVETNDKYVFLEQLAKTGYPEKKIQDELLNILLAGRDTTAGLLSYLFYHLAREPRIWEKLRAEVLSLGDETPSFEQIKSLKYMQWVLNEGIYYKPDPI